MWFTATPRGARLARRLVSHRLDEWGHGYDSAANETVTLIAAELAANAVRHGRVPGRDFEVRLVQLPGLLRIEVSGTRTERVPLLAVQEPPGDAESGRGLLLVAGLATRWGAVPRPAAPGKSVWAEYAPRLAGARSGVVDLGDGRGGVEGEDRVGPVGQQALVEGPVVGDLARGGRPSLPWAARSLLPWAANPVMEVWPPRRPGFEHLLRADGGRVIRRPARRGRTA